MLRLLKLGRTWLHPDRCLRTGELYERGIWQWRPTERASFHQYATTALVETAALQRLVHVQVTIYGTILAGNGNNLALWLMLCVLCVECELCPND